MRFIPEQSAFADAVLEGQVRRALAPPIHGGANEIQREIIGVPVRPAGG